MEMPIDAEGCEVIIRIQPNGEVIDLHGIHLRAKAIPVPPHGRLIDADALLKRIDGEWNGRTAFRAATIIEYINDAPTIISADKEATDDHA